MGLGVDGSGCVWGQKQSAYIGGVSTGDGEDGIALGDRMADLDLDEGVCVGSGGRRGQGVLLTTLPVSDIVSTTPIAIAKETSARRSSISILIWITRTHGHFIRRGLTLPYPLPLLLILQDKDIFPPPFLIARPLPTLLHAGDSHGGGQVATGETGVVRRQAGVSGDTPFAYGFDAARGGVPLLALDDGG